MKSKILVSLGLAVLYFYSLSLKNVSLFPLLVSVLITVLLILKFNKKWSFSFWIFLPLLLLIAIGIRKDFDKNLFVMGHLEAHKAVARQGYYVKEFGKIYSNRFGIFYSNKFRPITTKYLKNAFSHLDFNSYFKVNNLISILLLTTFFVGLTFFLKNINQFISGCFFCAFLASGFVSSGSEYGVVLFSPFVVFILSLGIFSVYKIFKK